jgi:ABC-type antimicrobial peptide transport system permease subunit
MYMLVFISGHSVMRRVIEEYSRVVIHYLFGKPVHYNGKITCIAGSLTQFLIWIVLTVIVINVLKTTVLSGTHVTAMAQQTAVTSVMTPEQQAAVENTPMVNSDLEEFSQIFSSAMSMPWGLIIFSFVFYFITAICCMLQYLLQ